jgi:hypothetical protein
MGYVEQNGLRQSQLLSRVEVGESVTGAGTEVSGYVERRGTS